MMNGIKVIAFDIDGTLYSSHRFYYRIVPYFLKHFFFFLEYNKVRKVLHKTAPLADFYEYQARLLAENLNCPVETAKSRIQQVVYDGLTPYFARTKPFKGVQDAFKAIHEAGYKIAILSDFPPSQKGEMWGLVQYCDLILGSEESGALKPSKYPFGVMANRLNVKPEEILYVGNSIKYDVEGSKNAGMKSAYILPFWRKILHLHVKQADINFSSYRQLADIVLR